MYGRGYALARWKRLPGRAAGQRIIGHRIVFSRATAAAVQQTVLCVQRVSNSVRTPDYSKNNNDNHKKTIFTFTAAGEKIPRQARDRHARISQTTGGGGRAKTTHTTYYYVLTFICICMYNF